MQITNTEFNVLRVMAEKEIDWTWIMLDRALAIRGIEEFSNVANIVTGLVNNGMVEAVYIENASKPRYRVSEQGHQLLRENNDN
ncbi:MarR family transcriptional regulator [Cronobacter sakazakii]|uniref:MarR family transcriptional regulator n=1 Tax=Cronobacter sakazakii TaxID=28141 RepID=UPI0018F8B13F|nr:MarR family transcriptional regulator [Cronobacter sakazakii]